MATILKKQIRIARTDSGTPPVIYELPEAANQTFIANSLVTLDANGRVTGATGQDDASFWGVAENAASNNAVAGARFARVTRLTTDLTFIGNMLTAAAADYVAAQADHGPMGIQYDATTKRHYLDASEQGGADDRVFVVAPAPGSQVGDTNADFYFKFLPAAIQG